MSGIYSITNLINGKRYIGQSTNIQQRWINHKAELRHNNHYNEHLQHAWNKYGEDNFCFEILVLCDKDDLDEKERGMIAMWRTTNPEYGYNDDDGGKAGRHLGVRHRQKIGAQQKGKTRAPFSEEHRRRLSLSHLGKITAMKGRHHTEESKQKLSESHKGKKYKPQTEEHKQKISAALTGIKREYNMKAVAQIDIDTGEIINTYPSIQDATVAIYGRKKTGSISDVCKGKRKTAGGYRWQYLDK